MSFLARLFKNEPNFDLKIIPETLEENEKYRLPYFAPGSFIFMQDDDISGNIEITLKTPGPLNHNGITVSVIGQFRQKVDGTLDQFYIKSSNIATPGSIHNDTRLPFSVERILSPIPSYYGSMYDARYIIEVKINSYTFQEPIYFLIPTSPPEIPEDEEYFKSDVGMQGILHIEIYFKNHFYDVTDTVYGYIYFHLVKLRIVDISFQIQRIEAYKNGIVGSKTKFNVATIQVLDGIPVRGDLIPVRCFMPGIKAWPYPKNANANLTVTYLVRLLLVDENGKHYYKELGDQIFRIPQ
ncbi:Vacuolar protein sorting-associated protein 26 containing protein [Tritrichomonas foetus]|uniref:Vacuolar protein sorting-associated protein 26 containing protein n=1 Tax=Tritrichomonas foetus TaxID=1144522 RepID=A0A1J4KFR8_9EUKA|nr:Vacuolar protein sorting-associated protein 26 containing protein [Tritrichomonas foetus]|eukprot:OHT09776.1 Vacuolar protein sorting-associated protein 26 containing protein [Tritrichomonas foetus]